MLSLVSVHSGRWLSRRHPATVRMAPTAILSPSRVGGDCGQRRGKTPRRQSTMGVDPDPPPGATSLAARVRRLWSLTALLCRPPAVRITSIRTAAIAASFDGHHCS
jgi:hypothetical protein